MRHTLTRLLPVLVLSGCAQFVQTKSRTQQTLRPPSSWVQASERNHGKISAGWLDEFDDAVMKRLVVEALDNNPAIGAAAARLRAAQRGTIGTRAALLPSIRSSLGGSRAVNLAGDDSADFSTNLNLSLNASWEPDLWGRLRDLNDASRHNLGAAIQDYRGARLSLAANTARAWSNLITSEQQLQLAQRTVDGFQKNLNIIERNYQAGIPGTPALAVQLSRTNVASAESVLEQSKLNRGEAARDLEVLLGRYPSNQLKAMPALPVMKSSVPAGLPAQLLARRPDIAAARHDIYAAAKLADAAQKSLLPSINLTGSSSSNQERLRELLDPQNLVANIAVSLSQNVFSGGTLRADIAANLALNEAVLLDYRQIVLDAYREVEDALHAEESLKNQAIHLNTEVKQASLAEKQAEQDFSEGVDGIDIISVLESQRRANVARSSLIILQNNRIQNRIDLHLALGGDFFTKEPTK